MSKNETFFVLLIFVLIFLIPLHADMTVGVLKSVENNTKQKLLTKNIPITCEAFGILTLEKISEKTAATQECKNTIAKFYKAHPHDKEFAKEHLHLEQSYHYETIKEGCILYANGNETYSEMLLRQGLALMDPVFDNNEWNGRLKRAQKGAEVEKIGLHDTLIKEFCIKEEK